MLQMLIDALRGEPDVTGIILYIFASLVVIFLTLPVHEYAHAFVANRLGDPTARHQGRLSINPMVHVDYIGALMILFFGFGWAKAVPVNMRNFRNPKRDMAITAAAGPVSNLIMAFFALIFYHLFDLLRLQTTASGTMVALGWVCGFFGFVASINISLAVFNLLPLPPLDGSRILGLVLPNRIYYTIMQYERYIFFLVLALVWLNVLDPILGFLTHYVSIAVDFLPSLLFGLFV